MSQSSDQQKSEWWQAVQTIAALVNNGTVMPDEDRAIRASLEAQGFSHDCIGQALDWVDRAFVSGYLHDSLGMLHAEPMALRMQHPLELVSIHPQLLRAVESGRRRGLFTGEIAERLLEGLRVVDTRDWDDDEVFDLLRELVAAMAPSLAGQDVVDLLFGPELYH